MSKKGDKCQVKSGKNPGETTKKFNVCDGEYCQAVTNEQMELNTPGSGREKKDQNRRNEFFVLRDTFDRSSVGDLL